jgi:hypothetical protein
MNTFSNDDECRIVLKNLQNEFEIFLADKLSTRTIAKHSLVIGCLIDFLCFDCALKSLDSLTIAMVNSKFRRWYINKIGDLQESELKVAVRKFFLFLEAEKNFNNKKILDSLKKK